MIESTAKHKLAEPAARPSRPSVRLTALEVPTRTNTAKTTQPTWPRCQPGELALVNDSDVDVWAQCTANSAKKAATATWAASFARLLRPRLRLLRTLSQSSRKPTTPESPTTMTTR